MVATLGDDTLALSTVQKWTAEFRKEEESPDNVCNGHHQGKHVYMGMDDSQLIINQ